MNKKLSRKQEEELRRRRMPRYAELLGAEVAFSSAAPYAPRPTTTGQAQTVAREEEQVRRAWAMSPASMHSVHRGMGNSAVRSILGGEPDFAARESIEPGKALLASLLARDVVANEAAGGAVPGSGGSGAGGSEAAAPADAQAPDGDAIHRDADDTIARDEDPRFVVRDEAAGIDVAYDPSGGAPDVDLKQVKDAMGSGQPLDAGTREYMEWRFGLSLGNVRIHTGPKADALSKALMAHAFALGADVNFAAGQYKPGTREGDFLLAHELAHVVQAGHATDKPTPAPQEARKSASVSEPDDAIEVEADQVAAEVVAVGRSEFAKAKRESSSDGQPVETKATPSPTARKAARLPAEGPARTARSGPERISRSSSESSPETQAAIDEATAVLDELNQKLVALDKQIEDCRQIYSSNLRANRKAGASVTEEKLDLLEKLYKRITLLQFKLRRVLPLRASGKHTVAALAHLKLSPKALAQVLQNSATDMAGDLQRFGDEFMSILGREGELYEPGKARIAFAEQAIEWAESFRKISKVIVKSAIVGVLVAKGWPKDAASIAFEAIWAGACKAADDGILGDGVSWEEVVKAGMIAASSQVVKIMVGKVTGRWKPEPGADAGSHAAATKILETYFGTFIKEFMETGNWKGAHAAAFKKIGSPQALLEMFAKAGLSKWVGGIAKGAVSGAQRKSTGPAIGDVASAAARGLAAASGSLPFADRIQDAFGAHDISGITAHSGPAAREAGDAMGAAAYATGSDVVFARTPDLHTAAHEAAHVIQQAHGVNLPGGVGSPGDAYERHADAVADAVVSGQSAEGLLDAFVGSGGSALGVQAKALSGPVQMNGEDSGPVISIQSSFLSPWSLQEKKMKPEVLTSYDDASSLAADAWAFVDKIVQYVDSKDPKYNKLNDALSALDQRMIYWGGNNDRLEMADATAFSKELASAENAVHDFSIDLSNCWIGAAWDYDKLKISFQGDLVLAKQKDIVRLSRRVISRLQPILKILETGPSKHIKPLEAEIKTWTKIGTDFDGGEFFTISTTFQPVLDAWDNTEALLNDLNNLPVRSQPIKMGKSFDMNGAYNISTYEAAAYFVSDVGSELFFKHSDLFPSKEDPPHRYAKSYEEWRNEWSQFQDTASEWGKASGDWDLGISDAQAKEIDSKVKQLEKRLEWVHDAFKADIKAAKAGLRKAARDAKEAEKNARDAMRAAFLSNASNPDIAFAGQTIDGLVGLAVELNSAYQEIGGWDGGSPGWFLRSELPGILGKGVSVANVIVDWSSETTMTKGSGFEGLAALENAMSVAGLVMTPTMALFTAHIGPMLKAITALMGKLQVQLIRLNDLAAEMGMDGQYYPGADPGGEDMWIFMSAVMHAGSAGGVPTPPGSVVEYFESFRDKIGAATQKKVPMDDGVLGTGFFQDLDTKAFKAYIFSTRDTVWSCLYGSRPVPVQRKGEGGKSDAVVQAAAERGTAGSGGPLPFGSQIQESFGKHDVSDVKAHTGPAASAAAKDMGARAYATGTDVAFKGTPDLHTAAHEAAHVVQQRAGVNLKGDVGQAGDAYEKHADLVADAVVAGQSAEPLLDRVAGGGAPGTGVQRKAVQMEGEDDIEREPKPEELGGANEIEQTASAGEAEGRGNDAPTPEVGPNPEIAGPDESVPSGGDGELMCLDPSATETPVSMPPEFGPDQGPRPSDIALDGAGPGHSEEAGAAAQLLGSTWNFTANCFGPLVGYNSDRGGFAFDNLWGVGAGIDKIMGAADKDRGEGALATTIKVVDTLRAISETVLSVSSAIGMTCGILSLIGLFPPLAPVGAALASVAGICSQIAFWAGIAATAFALITSVLSAIQLISAVKDGADNVAELYAQYQQDVGSFVADGIGILMVLGIKGITKGMQRAGGYSDGMQRWSQAVGASDGRVARGAAYQGLNSLGQAGAGTGITMSTAGTTRAMLQGTLQSNLAIGGVEALSRSAASRVAISSVKGSITEDVAAEAEALRQARAAAAASSTLGGQSTTPVGRQVLGQIQSLPDQSPDPVVPAPEHSTSELVELAQRRQEVAAARAHVDAQRIEGQTAIEGGQELQSAADQHEAAASGLDEQVAGHQSGLDRMHDDAQTGIDEANSGQEGAGGLGNETQGLQSESEARNAEAGAVTMPKPKKSSSWFDRLANWFQEKVFSKVGAALNAVREFVADIILKIVGFFMGVDDIDAQLAGVRGEMEAAQQTTAHTQGRTQHVSQQAQTAHQQASDAGADAQQAISGGEAAVSQADQLDAQLMSMDSDLAAQEQEVLQSTQAWQSEYGDDVDEAYLGGPVCEPGIISGLRDAAANALSGIDTLETEATTHSNTARNALSADTQASGLDAALLGGIATGIENDFSGLVGRMDQRRGQLAGLQAEIASLDGARYAVVHEQLIRVGGDIHLIAQQAENDAEWFRLAVQEALSEAAELMVCEADERANRDNEEQGLQSSHADAMESAIQRKASGPAEGDVVKAAQAGTSGSGGPLPFGAQIQKSFGSHDIGGVKAHTGPTASAAAKDMGAKAFATGNDVAFAGTPDLHTAAHEAAHVVQQRAGVNLKGNVGQAGDRYEKHADLVADAVVAGRSAEPLLNTVSGGGAPSTGVQRQVVQMDGDDEERTPGSEENAALNAGAPAVSQSRSAVPPQGAPSNPTPQADAGSPPPAIASGGGADELMCVEPSLLDPGVSMPPQISTPAPVTPAETIGNTGGATTNPSAEASGGLLSAAWGVTTDAMGPLVGYNRNRGGWKASNFLNIGPGIDSIVDTYNNDRGEGVWATVAEIASNVRAVAETIRSICSAVGLVTRVLSLVGLFPPLAPVGAFLATVSSLCSTISWISAIIVTVASAITTVASAIQLVQGVKSGAPNVAELYAQYQSDVSNFVGDGIGLAVDAVFKFIGPAKKAGSQATKGMGSYKDVLKTADGRVARGVAFQGLKNVGAPNLAGNLLSTAGSTRAALTGMLKNEVARRTVTKIGVDLVKRELKTGLQAGGRALGPDIADLTMPAWITSAATGVGSTQAPKVGDSVKQAVGAVPEQTAVPNIPKPKHTPNELDQIGQRRQEIAAARLHVDGVRAEGQAAMETGQALQEEADQHDQAASDLDGQVVKHKQGVDAMDSDAKEGMSQINKGEKESAKGRAKGDQVKNEGEKSKSEGAGVKTPKPKKATSWWGRLKAWFKEKVFKKVGEALDSVKEYIADMIMKAVAGIMGVDDIDAQLADAKEQMAAAQGANQETRAGTQEVSGKAGEAHSQAASASSDAQEAISRGQKTVAEADAMDAQLQAEDAKLQAEAAAVDASNRDWMQQHGAEVDIAAQGGHPVDGAILAGLESAISNAAEGIDGLEDIAANIGQQARDGLVQQAEQHSMDPSTLAGIAGEIESRFSDLTGRMDGRRGTLAGLAAQVTGLSGQPYALIEEQLGEISGQVHGVAGEADADFAAFRDAVVAALQEAAALYTSEAAEVVTARRASGVQQKKAGAPSVQRKAEGESKVQRKEEAVQLKGGDEKMQLKSAQRSNFKLLQRLASKDPSRAPKRKTWMLVKAACANWQDHLDADIKPDARITKMQAELIQLLTKDPLKGWFDRTAKTGKPFARDLKKAFKLLKSPKFIGGAEEPGEGVQKKGGDSSEADVHAAAAAGTAGSGGSLPFASQIQKSFGSHDVSGVSAHTGPQATAAAKSMGASAFATGNDVAFAGSPDLHTAAHEAAHVVQQRAGVSLAGGVGKAGDKYENHADAVADAVVAGKSAEPILDAMAGAGKSEGVQKSEDEVQLKGDGSFSYVETGAFGGRASFDVQMKVSVTPKAPVQMEDGPACTPGESTDGSAVFLPNAVPAVGEVAYYQQRHDDFAARYPDGPAPPTYYLGYGGKYVARFTNELYPQLSPAGQAWLVQTRINLQTAIENRRAADPAAFDALEKNDTAFTAFAYETHADAYLNAGLQNLNPFDLARVGLTPDVQDLLTREGIAQAAEVGVRLIPLWGADAIDYIGGDGTTEEMQEVMIEGYEAVGDGIDEIWGEGTSRQVLDNIESTARAAEEIGGYMYDEGYDLAEQTVGDWVEIIDSEYGEGTSGHAANAVRLMAQDAVDEVEGAWDTAVDTLVFW